jgi:hypothetical protein
MTIMSVLNAIEKLDNWVIEANVTLDEAQSTDIFKFAQFEDREHRFLKPRCLDRSLLIHLTIGQCMALRFKMILFSEPQTMISV